MIIDKIQYCDYDYTLKQIIHGNYYHFRIYKKQSNHKVVRGTEPKYLVKREVDLLTDKRVYAGKDKAKIEQFAESMKDELTNIVFDVMSKTNSVDTKISKTGE